MQTLWQDLKYGIRMLANSPGFSAASILCLALGIGATTAIFSIVNAVLLRPLPYAHADRLVRLYSEFPTFKKFWVSAPEFLELRRDSKSWDSLEAWVNQGVNLTGSAEPIRVTASYVTGGLLPSLGVSPVLGRLITPQDDTPTAPLTIQLSYGLWQRAFGGDPGILGREVLLNGRKCTVLGVMPKGFQFPPGETDPPEIWTPLQIDPASPGGRSAHFLSTIATLKPGVTIFQARDQMKQLLDQWEAGRSPNRHILNPKNHPVVMFPFQDEVVGGVRLAMLMLLGAVAFVLLIACVNVANLLLARAEARQREIAIRKAMGAAVGRLARQFVTEGVVLSLIGALLGLALAYGGLRAIAHSNAASIPRSNEISVDPTVLLFTLGVSLLTGIAFGLAPLAQIVAGNVHDTLKAAASRTTASVAANRFRRALVVSELALALVLLIGTGLMIRAFWKLQEVHPGFKPDRLLTMRVALPQAVYPQSARVAQFWGSVQQRMAALPGVESATVINGLPPARQIQANDTQIEGWVQRDGGPIQNIDYWQFAGPRYFETMGIRLIDGRYFDDRDGEGAPLAVIVNQSTARAYWPGQNAIGHRMKPGFQGEWRTVVGVVEDVKNAGLDKPAGTELYLPIRQAIDFGLRTAYVVLRTKGDPEKMVSSARGVIRDVDSSLPVAAVRTMDDVLSSAQARPRFLTMLLTMFASVALVLAAVGIYGVISYSVAQRTSEFGIRMAMGASPGDVLGMVLGQGLLLGGIGVALGAAGALALTRLIRGLLFGISSFDPITFVAMAGVLTVVTLAACWIPARRATRVDPMVALRYE
ncbi:MAG TPA: ABC transporter permease [Bryobacteraceae bacterium]|nr:ABC transporter permease [Bryobacteraceae bacterium]